MLFFSLLRIWKKETSFLTHRNWNRTPSSSSGCCSKGNRIGVFINQNALIAGAVELCGDISFSLKQETKETVAETVKALTTIGGHANILSIHNAVMTKESDTFIAMQRVHSTLTSYIEKHFRNTTQSIQSFQEKGLMFRFVRGVVDGMVHLHSTGYASSKLDIENVYIVNGVPKLYIPSIVSVSVGGADDLISLGKILLFCLTGGASRYDHLADFPELADLISKLLFPSLKWLTIWDIAKHPVFWDANMRIHFIHRASSMLHDSRTPRMIADELDRKDEFLGWMDKADPRLLTRDTDDAIRAYRLGESKALVRFVRNKIEHSHEYKFLREFGELRFVCHYFECQYKNLVLHTYNAFLKSSKDLPEDFKALFMGSGDFRK